MNFIECQLYGADQSIALLRLSRPKFANAYNNQMLSAMEQQLKAFAYDNSVRALIITGEGQRVFCAGADKNEIKSRRALDGLNLVSKYVFDLLANMTIPTIAAINGAAIGGGLELALACDIRITSQTAKFALPEIKLGLTPAAGGLTRLLQMVGVSRAKEMILFGREIDAERALEWGLVSQLSDDVISDALALATWVISQDPLALRLAKQIMNVDYSRERHDLSSMAQALLYEQKYQKKNNE
ncbi:enoyl-CoA hydratase/isomerase family protein [Mucilaginibacter sp. RCC_168]|uniref:enoyl-CoA hydratase/isomerase family protein n=1 Tax=Mucilaginibacter sp. RCC_168 TaxID=3239221 RepID=UPI003523F07C